VKLAALISSKAVKRSVTEADHLRLVDEALAELNTTVTKA
jgi:F0F1-type ATP synthase membrane subunit b/b'